MADKKVFDDKKHITRSLAATLVKKELTTIKRITIGSIAASVLAFIANGFQPLIGLAILMGLWFWMGLTFNNAKQYFETLETRYKDEQGND